MSLATASRSYPRRRRVMAAATALGLVGLSGCGGMTPPSGPALSDGPRITGYLNERRSNETPVLGNTLVYGIPAETNSWNPAQAEWGPHSLTVARTFYDFLAEHDESGVARPSLATVFTPNASFTAWTVKLRGGVSFSDGQPLTAEAVVRGQQLMRSSPVTADALREVDRWEIVDDLTFTVHFTTPFTVWPELMTTQLGAVASPEWMEHGDWQHPVGTGPFAVVDWEVGARLVVRKNARYWRADADGHQLPFLDQVEFRVIPDESERTTALRKGDFDVVLDTAMAQDIAALRRDPAHELQVITDERVESAEEQIVLNTSVAPFDDPDARAAIAHAIDRDAYAAAVTHGLGRAADGFFEAGSPWYAPTKYPSFDIGRATELAAAVKARHGGEFAFELQVTDTPATLSAARHLVDRWQTVGITATIKAIPQAATLIDLVTGNFQAMLTQSADGPHAATDTLAWSGRPVDPGAWSLNGTRLADPAIMATRNLLVASSDRGRQHELMATIQARLAELVPSVPLVHASRTIVASPHVVNLVDHTLPDGSAGLDLAQGSHALAQVWLAN